jgi:hypothetical protein
LYICIIYSWEVISPETAGSRVSGSTPDRLRTSPSAAGITGVDGAAGAGRQPVMSRLTSSNTEKAMAAVLFIIGITSKYPLFS